MYVGVSPLEVMKLTPYQIGLVIEAYNKRLADEYRRALARDWYLGMLAANRIDVTFDKFIGDNQHQAGGSAEETKAAIVAQARAYNRSQKSES